MDTLKRGFTIVELLIVIVVIAILASITLVTYDKIQDQAHNAALVSGMDTVQKALEMYKIQHGAYPVPTDLPPWSGSQYVACINAQLPAENGYLANQCSTEDTAPYIYAKSSVLDAALETEISALPDTHDYSVESGGASYRGLIYVVTSDGDTAELEYVVNGDQKCGRGQALSNGMGGTVCALVMD